jgi:hypothetical protein
MNDETKVLDDLQDSASDESKEQGESSQEPTERLYKNAEVSKVVARERQKAYEKGKKDALMQQQQELQAAAEQQQDMQQAQQPPQQQQQYNIGGMQQPHQQGINPDLLSQLISEQLPKHIQSHIQNAQTEQFVNSFASKMEAAEQHYPGLEEKLNMLDYSDKETLALAQMANSLENTGDIMNELLDNPEKLGTMLNLIGKQPKFALSKLQSLSNSIKQNQTAKAQTQTSNNPISQIKPSQNAGMDNGNMSVSDYSKWFREIGM